MLQRDDKSGSPADDRKRRLAAAKASLPDVTVRLPDTDDRDVAADTPIGRVDRYLLLNELGSGGFGAVFRAHDEVAKLMVALKALPPVVAQNPNEFEKVRENFRLVAKLRHPGIANVLHLHTVENVDEVAQQVLGVRRGDHLIVMDYVEGQTLQAWRKQFPKSRVPVNRAVDIAARIAEALDYAHSQKIIHRDIKPANVMLTPDGQVRILDFGLAAQIRTAISRVSRDSNERSGTPAYMAPETWAGKRQRRYADQYGMAVLFYEMVSGSVPFAEAFESDSPLVMYHAVRNQVPDPVPELSRKQNRALLRALAKNPWERFDSCGAFVEALAGEGPVSRIAPAAQSNSARVSRMGSRRRRGGDSAAWWIVALFLLVVSAVGGYLGTRRYAAYQEYREEQLRQAASNDRNREQILELLTTARAASQDNRHADAADAVRKALKLDPNNVAAQSLRDDIARAVDLAVVVPVRSEVEMVWKRARALQRGQGIGQAMDRGEALFEEAGRLIEAKQYRQALEAYQTLIAEGKRLLKLDAERQAAIRENEAAARARASAEAADGRQEAAEVFSGAVQLYESAGEAFEAGAFNDASRLWITASAEFAKAEASAKGALAVRIARAACEQDLFQTDMTLLTEFGGAELANVQMAIAEAERLASDGNWSDSVRKWEEARGLLVLAVDAAHAAHLRFQHRVDEHAQTAPLRSAHLAEIIARAKTARAAEDWETVLRNAEEALKHDPDSVRAKVLRNEAQAALVPRLRVVAVVEGREVEGADVAVDGVMLPEKTPVDIRLERGRTYRIRVMLNFVDGGRRYVPFETDFHAEEGGERVLRAVLEPVPLPSDLREVQEARPASLAGLGAGSLEAQARQQQCAEQSGRPLEVRTAKTGIRMRLIPHGSFIRKNPAATTLPERAADTDAESMVTISSPFYITTTEITARQWAEVMDAHGHELDESLADLPIAQVAWEECMEFCRRLCVIEGVVEGTYRLLTEAEWEYACRAGTNSKYYGGDGEAALSRCGWVAANSSGRRHPVGLKQSNAWGVYDMHGNVAEWCLDWFGPVEYTAPNVDPTGPENGVYRVVRGGSWDLEAAAAASAARGREMPESRSRGIGFRIQRTLVPDSRSRAPK